MKKKINLRLFSEGGEGGATLGSDGAEGTSGINAEEGKSSSPEGTTGQPSREEMKAKFEEMIKGDYKEFYQENFNNAFGKRFKEMKGNEERLKSYEEDLTPLYERYGAKNPSDLVEAIMGNPATYLDEAEKTGESSDVLAAKKMLEIERSKRQKEEAKKASAKAEADRLEAINKQISAWEEEGKKVKELHPEFDLRSEMQKKEFGTMLRAGVPMINAYRALHHEDIAKGISESAKKAAFESFRQNGGRASEVGADSSKPLKADLDVNSLSDSDIDEILERVAKGEKISFAQ